MSTEVDVVEVEQPEVAKVAKVEPPKVDPGVQKRIDQMTFKYREEQRRASAAEAKLAEYESKARQVAPPAETEKRKTLADFSYDDVAYEDYLAERVTKRAESSAAKKAEEVVVERETKKAQETTASERAAKWKASAEAFSKDHPDFVERVYGDDLPFTDAVAELVADSDIGPQLAYHLAQNPDDLARISKLSPAAAGREIGKLEAKLATAPSSTKEDDADETASAQDPPTTKAPPPPPKLQPAASSSTRPSTTLPASDKLSDDEWFRAEQQRVLSRRKAK